MLEVNGVSKLYENSRGVKEINFSMQRGEIVGFLGPNGAGKTTTMRMITGYLNPTGGNILVDGLSMADHPRKARRKIGYLPETPPLYPEMTVRSYLKFVADLRDVPVRAQKGRVNEIIDKLGLNGRENQIIRSLSKGYKQRLGLAQAIVHKPDLLVLDEPTSGLDPKQIIEIRSLIRELGENHTVLLSTHILPEVNTLCNRVLIINQGQIVLDEKPEMLGATMGDTFEVSLEVKGPREEIISLLGTTAGIAAVRELADGAPAAGALGLTSAPEAAASGAGEAADAEAEAASGGAGDPASEAAEAAAVTPASPDAAGADASAAPQAKTGGQQTASPGGTAPDTVKLLVSSADSTDIREPLFFRLAEAGYPILEMKRESLSLEDIFLKLTTDESLSGSVEDEPESRPGQSSRLDRVSKWLPLKDKSGSAAAGQSKGGGEDA
ncbi:ABC transporter ATP-binding protein [Paenibacillus chitinolyticus]|uniref:ABC transporter ATP-binding protein n=1 Tax=Paenibacillus chitinolyticus TaxID=79263 RepID=UPI001C49145D|nr:ABC transporter ATP-binding protein [Paenibacillus chitinolyticus]MBV6716737.1 ABC transporter ATP-binding protein [Paenibacillus chitinolyticus]